MNLRRAWVVAIASSCVLVGLSSCGGDRENSAVVRIDGQLIGKATVEHWTEVIRRGGGFTGLRGEPRGTPRQRALSLLISCTWLADEAARRGVAASRKAIDRALVERKEADQGAEFQEQFDTTGQTLADTRREVTAELDLEAIRRQLARRAVRISQQAIAAFYHRNIRLFRTPEVRVVDLIEQQPSAAAALALVERIGSGRRFEQAAYHERVSRGAGVSSSREKATVVKAIFAARIGVVSRPMMLGHRWTVFVVRRAIPPSVKPLANVHRKILLRLRSRRERELATRFSREYTTRWVARTRCQPTYVVAGCSQSTGQVGVYEDPFAESAR
jgi:hypothetical protein